MRLKITSIVFLLLLSQQVSKAQVWFPEGVYTQALPQLVAVDNQIITVARTGFDINGSYWQVCINDGRSWIKLPLLTLSKTAEILDVKKFQGMVYLCGNFTFDNGAYNGLVRFNLQSWQGINLFKKPGQLPASILTMDIQNNNLILGGSFYTIGNDTLPYICRFNGIKFSEYFDKCRDCEPDNIVIDIASNDSVVAICGQFTTINHQKSKYLYRYYSSNKSDTFINTPKLLEKIAIDGSVVYGSGGLAKDKRLYKVSSVFTEINSNLDSALHVSEILVWDGKPVICGAFYLSSNAVPANILRLDGSIWKNISNNLRNAGHIATGRSFLIAVGNSPHPLSIWNPNRFVHRFYPNLSLVKAKVFLDSNNNCIHEKNEKTLSKQFIKLPFLNKGVFTNEAGLAEFMVPNAIQNTLRFVVKPFRSFTKSNCSDTAVNKTFYPGVYSDSIQFPLNRVPNVNDIRVLLSSPRGKQVVKDKKVLYYITYENVGSNPLSGSISLKKSPLFTKEQTLPLFKTKLNDSTLQWEYSNLQPGERKTIVYTAYPEDLQFSQQFQFDAKVACSISNGSSQYSGDDYDSIPQESTQGINAFRKDVFPTPSIGDSITYLDASERDLRYNISFNNFSTDTVFYAVIIDTLDLNLDMSFIEETGSNKNYYTEVQTDPNNSYKGILIWHFPDIRLVPNPGMNYEILESGSYIGFRVVTKPLSQGYFLRNTASVFYDNNFAGNTNSVYCTLAISSIDEMNSADDNIKLYPNPFSHSFELVFDLKQGDKICLTDASGKLVFSDTLNSETGVYLFNAELANGIYVLQIYSGGQIFSRKIVRE